MLYRKTLNIEFIYKSIYWALTGFHGGNLEVENNLAIDQNDTGEAAREYLGQVRKWTAGEEEGGLIFFNDCSQVKPGEWTVCITT